MIGESWCTIKDFQALFPVLNTGRMHNLLVRVLIVLRCDTVKGEIIEGLNNCVFADIWVFKH